MESPTEVIALSAAVISLELYIDCGLVTGVRSSSGAELVKVVDDVLHAPDGGESGCAVAFFVEALSDAGMDKVSKVFRQGCLYRGVLVNDTQLCRHFDVLV